MKYSKNADAAKAFIRWSMQDSVWMPWFEVAGSFHNGVGPKQNNNPLWAKFPPSVQVFKNAPVETHGIGWPGPANQKAAVALSKFIVVDMLAMADQATADSGLSPWTENESRQIYT